MEKFKRLTLQQRRGIWGFIFLLPWILGFFMFFFRPFAETVRYAFSTVELTPYGIEIEFLGFDNFVRAFTIDPHFFMYMYTLAFPSLVMVAIVVIFSLLAAILINGKYFGRSLVRTVFFIPIIMGANIAQVIVAGDDVVTQATVGDLGFGGFTADFFIFTLIATGMPIGLVMFVIGAIAQIFQVLAQSGVPILIFLAGLQSIPPSMYEVAKVEGSTAYETFFKVTLPMISPMILISTIYTVTDLFRRHSMSGVPIAGVALGTGQTPLLEYIRFISFGAFGSFGLASAMAASYIIACLLVIVAITFVMSKAVFYYE